MHMSVPIGSCGAYGPVITLTTALGISWDRTVYVVHWQSMLYKSYTTLTLRLAAPA